MVPLPQVALAPFELVSDQPADALQAPLAGELVRVAVHGVAAGRFDRRAFAFGARPHEGRPEGGKKNCEHFLHETGGGLLECEEGNMG